MKKRLPNNTAFDKTRKEDGSGWSSKACWSPNGVRPGGRTEKRSKDQVQESLTGYWTGRLEMLEKEEEEESVPGEREIK